jgi:hypothetical protein
MSAAWQLDGSKARLIGARAGATIDLAHPAHGLAISLPGVAPDQLALRMLGIEIGEENTRSAARLDAYVRGADLVATYDESPPASLRTQSYWRILEPSEFAPQSADIVIAAFDLILSVNTSLLDNNPQSRVLSHVSQTQECFELIRDENERLDFRHIEKPSPQPAQRFAGTGCYLYRFVPADFTFLQMVHPIDFGGAFAGSESVSHQLFHQRLEKGVILRARMRAAVLRRSHDLPTAQAAYERFASAEPPLTV